MASSIAGEPLDVLGVARALGLSDRASGGLARQLAQQAVASLSSDGRWLALASGKRYALVELLPGAPPRLHANRALVTVPGTQEAVTAAALLTLPDGDWHEDGLSQCLLLLGSSRGYLHVAAADGRPLLRERLHDGACCSIALDGSSGSESGVPEGVTIGFSTAIARVDADQLLNAAHSASQQTHGGGLTSGALRCTKWELPKAVGPRSQAVFAGRPTQELYDCLAGRTSAPALLFLTAGRAPAVACFEAAEAGGAGVFGLVSDLAAGVGGVARTLVRGRPDGFRAGLGSWLGRLGGSGAGAAAEGPEIPSPKAAAGPSCHLGAAFDDEPREVLALLPAPRGALAAAADSLGRVLLLDTACMAVVRVWKAYRSAQLAWLTLPQGEGEEPGHSQTLLLVLYSPKRGLLEVWRPRLGPRVCSWPRGRTGRLLAPATPASEGGALRPLFLDCESGVLEDVAALAAAELQRA